MMNAEPFLRELTAVFIPFSGHQESSIAIRERREPKRHPVKGEGTGTRLVSNLLDEQRALWNGRVERTRVLCEKAREVGRRHEGTWTPVWNVLEESRLPTTDDARRSTLGRERTLTRTRTRRVSLPRAAPDLIPPISTRQLLALLFLLAHFRIPHHITLAHARTLPLSFHIRPQTSTRPAHRPSPTHHAASRRILRWHAHKLIR